ncbi:MAG: winged helix-turn-helix transcriptional regulator [Roseiflexaceae bacterium]|nr:winged helix-turn-helix transcriptional regulator [Roseiflexaceae bacterium]
MSTHADAYSETHTIVDPDAVQRVHDHALTSEMTTDVAEIFKAMADPTRVRILHALSHAELCVGDLSAVLGMKEPAVSHQLRLLRSLRVVRARRDGKQVYYTLDDDHVRMLFQLSLEHVGHR